MRRKKGLVNALFLIILLLVLSSNTFADTCRCIGSCFCSNNRYINVNDEFEALHCWPFEFYCDDICREEYNVPAGTGLMAGNCWEIGGDKSTTTTAQLTTTTSKDITNSSTTSTSSKSCGVKELYGEYSKETELLRYIRDNVLSQTPEGKELIKLYYQWSPAIVKAMEKDEEFKEEVKEMFDGVLDVVGGEVE